MSDVVTTRFKGPLPAKKAPLSQDRPMKLVYDVARKEWPGAALTAPAVADTGRGADVANGTCSIAGCENGGKITRGWCVMHYCRWKKHGDPNRRERIVGDDVVRFWSHVDKNGFDGAHFRTGENLGQCWPWTASRNDGGYGHLSVEGRTVYAHRFAYELLVGLISPGLELDHLCRVRHCVRPSHLEPVTHAENILRGDGIQVRNAAKTACPAGHAYSTENTILRKGGGRACRVCKRAHDTAYRAQRRAA